MSSSHLNSRPILKCQICASPQMRPLLFLGYVPPVNTMPAVGARAVEQPAFPLELFRCEDCGLAQIGLEARTFVPISARNGFSAHMLSAYVLLNTVSSTTKPFFEAASRKRCNRSKYSGFHLSKS